MMQPLSTIDMLISNSKVRIKVQKWRRSIVIVSLLGAVLLFLSDIDVAKRRILELRADLAVERMMKQDLHAIRKAAASKECLKYEKNGLFDQAKKDFEP